MVDNERVRFLHYIRQHELEASLEAADLKPGAHVLDFGAGDGFAAKLISDKGYNVLAVDLAPRSPAHFPVIKIGTPELPFADDSFDFIYSSNVLEHVETVPETLKELSRILHPTGTIIFTMPTPMWRLCALLEIPFLFLRAIFIRKEINYFEVSQQDTPPVQQNQPVKKKRPFWPRIYHHIMAPHGVSPSSLHELYDFSEIRWKNVFKQNHYKVKSVIPMPIFYTASLFFHGRLLSLRRIIPNRITASCLAYHVEPLENNKVRMNDE